jgi:hypothetical protein
MISCTTTQPPAADGTRTGERQEFILVKLNLPDFVLMPASNYAGTMLLSRLLEAHLAAAGVRVAINGAVGGLNQSHFILEVNDRPLALRTVIETLAEFRPFAIVAWLDLRENVFRTEFPRRGDLIEWPSLEIAACDYFIKGLLAQLQAAADAQADPSSANLLPPYTPPPEDER